MKLQQAIKEYQDNGTFDVIVRVDVIQGKEKAFISLGEPINATLRTERNNARSFSTIDAACKVAVLITDGGDITVRFE